MAEAPAAVRRLVAFYVGEHNEKLPRALLGGRHQTRCTSAGRRICDSGSPSNARERSGSGARRIEQRVAIAANLHARVLLCRLSPDHRLVENLLEIVHEVCVSSTAHEFQPANPGHKQPQTLYHLGKLCDELLNGEIFYTLKEAKVLIEKWRQKFNCLRPHSIIIIGTLGISGGTVRKPTEYRDRR